MSEEGLQYRYDGVNDDRVLVGVNHSLYYTKTIAEILRLWNELKAKIPFEFSAEEPEVYVIGGDRRRGMISVEMVVKHNFSKETVIAELESSGFCEGFDLYLG